MDLNATASWIQESSGAWGARVQDPRSVKIAANSALAHDQALPGGVTHAHFAWRSLGTAGEHLGAGHYMTISSGGGVRTKPYLSLARATMLGAARALFLLEPISSLDRRRRALQLLRAEAMDLHRLVADWESVAGSTSVVAARTEVDHFRQECERELVRSGLKPGSVMSETSLLLEVAHHLDDGVPDPTASVMDVWRLSSATAHARTWFWDSGLEDEDYLVQHVRIWSVPVGLMEAAWGLWNVRRAEPTA